MNHKAASVREKLARLRASFLEQLPERLSQAAASYAQLVAHPADGEAAAELHRFLHSIKGTGRSFGFNALATVAAHGEELAAAVVNGTALPGEDWQRQLQACLDGMSKEVQSLTAQPMFDAPAPGFDLRTREDTPAKKGGRLVYLCDDDPFHLEQTVAQVTCFGYEPVGFLEPRKLREAVLVRRPDAIVMDINFPEGDCAGTDALQLLEREIGASLPTVYLSGRNDFAARLAAVQSGGEAYLLKPAQAMDLVAALDQVTRQQQPEPFRILIIDDEQGAAAYHALILQEAGMITHEVQDPRRAVEALQEFRPDIVLMDMYMPICSGRDLARVIRQLPEYVGLPIVFLSSETDKQKQFSAMRVGAEGFLTKPVVPDELVAAVAIRAERMRELRSLMARDSLTGLFNHTTTTQLLDNAIATARRSGDALSLAMIDIDHFKAVNDTHGHPAGDQVILALARMLQQRLRGSDIVGRYGGEEFAVILPGVGASAAGALLDTLRDGFGRVVFHAGESDFSCTFSAGVVALKPDSTLEGLREAADKALYAAKWDGRNRVVATEDK